MPTTEILVIGVSAGIFVTLLLMLVFLFRLALRTPEIQEPVHYKSPVVTDQRFKFLTPEERAQELLFENLNSLQQNDWLKNNGFNVRGSDGGLWRITGYYGHSEAEVHSLGRHGDDATWCIHAMDVMPVADHALTFKLYLEANEPKFRAIGNRRAPRVATSSIHSYGGAI